MKNLQTLYRMFMWDKVKEKMNLKFNEILEVGFVNNFYVVVLKDKFFELGYKIIVDNIKKPVEICINAVLNRDKYHTFYVDELKRIPLKLYKALNKRGLFMTDKDRTKYNAWTSIHRLVIAVHGFRKDLPIHHIDKDKGNNDIYNLVPLPEKLNNEIEYYFSHGEKVKALKIGRDEWLRQEQEIEEKERCKKQYVTDNDNLKEDIIKFGINHKVKEAIKEFKSFIATPQKVRDIFNYFFYKEEFIEWLRGYRIKHQLI